MKLSSYDSLLDYCKSSDVDHGTVIKAIVAGYFNKNTRLVDGVCAYFYNPKTTREFASEALVEECKNYLNAIMGNGKSSYRGNLGVDRLWLEVEILVRSFLDSPNQDINVVINFLKDNLVAEISETPKEANYLASIILRHPRCNFAAVKYFIAHGNENIKRMALKHRFAKKLSCFY